MSPMTFLATVAAALIGVALGALNHPFLALGWILLSTMAILTVADDGRPATKTLISSILGAVGFFIFATTYGIKAAPERGVLEGLAALAHAIHLEIFVFLTGLYLVVNTFAYSGFIGDLAWRIVKRTQGRLGQIMVAIMVLTCVLSGIFDGATVSSIMGIITLTILLSSGMQTKDIIKILLLLVVATNLGGVWFVLGEPTNILAAEKLDLSPLFFLRYASVFSLPAIALCAFMAWRIVRRYPRIKDARPEMEVLLEGISLRRAHSGSASLQENLRSIGTVEVRSLVDMERIMEEEGLPDFEAALKAGIPQKKVHAALAINLNSEDLAKGLIDFYYYRAEGDPLAEIILGDLLLEVRDEYRARTSSRRLIVASGVILIGLLVAHAFIPWLPTWASTIIAGILAIAAVKPKARKFILHQTFSNLEEALFLVGIFVTISELNMAGAFELLGKDLLHAGSTAVTGGAILTGSAVFSAVADNVAVIDVLTNLVVHHEEWSFFALAALVGTALGGFASPIASVQAVIMATLLRRVAKVGFGRWLAITLPWFLVLLAASLGLLALYHLAGMPPIAPLPVGTGSGSLH